MGPASVISPAFTPVFFLTGFLGAGKTTVLRRLLRDPGMADSAVLINEFGDVGLDHHLVGRIDETMVLLKSGCLCCTIRGELAAAIGDLHSKRARGLIAPFRRLIIETTGLADPLPALSTLTADPVLRHHFRLGGVITVVEATGARRRLARQPESVPQVAVADRLVLSKTDLCGEVETADAVAAIRAINADAPLLLASDDLPSAAILGHRATTPNALHGLTCIAVERGEPATDAAGLHGEAISSFVVTVETAIDWTVFGLWLSMLLSRHGDRILRVKGLLNVAGTDGPVAIHAVQSLVHTPEHLAEWPDDDRRSRLVFITRGIAPALISRSLKAFGLLAAAPT